MKFLTKRNDRAGLAVHIADQAGAPLCGKRLKLETWRLHTYLAETDVLCASCRRIYAAQPGDQTAPDQSAPESPS